MNAVAAPAIPRYVLRLPQQYRVRWAGGLSGLGQDCELDPTQAGCQYGPPLDSSSSNGSNGSNVTTLNYGVTLPSTASATASSGGGTPTSSSTGFNWGSLISNSVNQAGKAAVLSTLPAGSTVNPTTGAVTIGYGTSALTNSTILPILMVAGVAVLILAMAVKSR